MNQNSLICLKLCISLKLPLQDAKSTMTVDDKFYMGLCNQWLICMIMNSIEKIETWIVKGIISLTVSTKYVNLTYPGGMQRIYTKMFPNVYVNIFVPIKIFS